MPVDGLFTFSSEPAINLHHLLYAEAWAIEAASTSQPSKAQPVSAELALRQERVFGNAVDYYRDSLIARDLLFDDTMTDLSRWLTDTGGSTPAGWEEIFSPVLARYRASDWLAHDQENTRWSARTAADLATLLPAVSNRLEQAYRQQLPDPPLLVSTVLVGGRLPAYTSLRPTHITCSTTHPQSQGLTATEIVLHEASHSLADNVRLSIREHVDVSRPDLRQLWHVVLFFITGEIVARAFAERGVAYTPYLESTGLFDRAWPNLRHPVTDACSAYLDGEWDWDTAVERLVNAVAG